MALKSENILGVCIILSLLTVPLVYARYDPGGETVEIHYLLQEVLVDATLHRDGSVGFTYTMGVSHFPDELKDLPDGQIISEIFLPINSDLSPIMELTDVVSGENYNKVYHLDIDCEGTLIFDDESKKVVICAKPTTQSRYVFKGTLLPSMDSSTYQSCMANGFKVGNTFTLPINSTGNEYLFSIIMQGDKDVIINSSNPLACKGNLENGSIPLTRYEYPNGLMCQGTIPADLIKSIDAEFSIGGYNLAELSRVRQETHDALQESYLEAQTRVTRVAWLNLLVTIILAGITYWYAKTTYNQLWTSVMPSIIVNLEYIRDCHRLVLRNVGPGTACKVNLRYSCGSTHKTETQISHIYSGDSIEEIVLFLGSDMSEYQKILKSHKIIDVIVEYQNIFGKKISNRGGNKFLIDLTSTKFYEEELEHKRREIQDLADNSD